MTDAREICPFKVGDVVIYRPSARGLALDVMSSADEQLVPGKEYVVHKIEKQLYVVVEGYRHPGGGIYWTEFVKTEKPPEANHGS